MATEAPISIIMPQLLQPRSRPTSLLLSPNTAYGPTSRGILLNARSPLSPSSAYSSGFNTPRSPSPAPAAVQLDSGSQVYSPGSRKIRFAPLPEPRREVTVDEDGTEIPCASTCATDATAYPVQSPATTSVTLDRTDSLVTDSGASTNSTDETQSQKSAKRSKRNSLLRFVGLGSSSSLSKRPSTVSLPTSDSGLFSTMFRTTSRESSSGEPSGYTSDNSIARRKSSPLRPSSAGGRPSSGYASFGAPLAHSVSDGTGARPQRMLNGRVYGARRARERLQSLPSMEPEFSEWGYGGMGSVSQGSEYSKLQSKTSSLGGPGGNDDEDDGSGLTWVRKRKEKKEREEREKREAEEAAAKAAQAEAEATSNPPRTSTETAGSSTTVHAERSETPTAPQTPAGTTTAISPPRSRTISSPPSRQNSGATVTPDRHHPTVVAVPAHRGRQEASVPNSSVVTSPETSPERSSGSSRRSSSSDDEDAEDSTGREDEEEEEENQKRKTALSAGVEKISRHH
ncbi:hypothetical protein RSOLAG22IIIB_00870 [Rhizoctonia solani]|uniref:Uncharacterized protein n=1 Tax=Rhizoctonia solani TaxID=456999 RepID=A0A0K6G1S2_9AGAM|nr:hypothetical protein RSOLAG22IIIB_00870 [Rhizoctonia solani]